MLLWGFNFIALKLVLREMTPNALALVRTMLAYAVLFPICWFRGISLRYPAGEAWRVLLQGALAMGIYLVIFFRGMQGSTPAEGAIILGTGPAFTLIIAVLVKQERFKPQALIGIVIGFAGVVLVVLSGPVSHAYSVSPSEKLAGNLTVLAGAVVWAISVVVTRPLVGKIEPLRLFTLSLPGALIVLLPFGLWETVHTNFAAFSASGWGMLLYVTYLAGVVGFAVVYQGVKEVGASGAMTYQYLVAPLAAVFGWIWLNTPVTVMQLLGMVVVLGGVAVSSRARDLPAREVVPEIPE